ncbi:MAG TPA: DUF1254 domain-containing protein [Burkholderiales bacterium]|nr:DUF1254 domain-containing protein [Burkholderiales bacterium]
MAARKRSGKAKTTSKPKSVRSARKATRSGTKSVRGPVAGTSLNHAPEVTQPAAGSALTVPYMQAVARMAYVWGWPLVNQLNRREAIRPVPAPGRLNGVVPTAPVGRLGMLNDYIAPNQTFIACPNQDVVYGASFFELDKGPVVIQVPDFGKRFWVYALYDGRTDQFGELGKPYKTRPGFYLLAAPGWKGTVPKGIAGVIRSPTDYANAIPRIFMDDTDEDRKAIQPVLEKISIYPLMEYDGKVKIIEWSKAPSFPGPKSEGGAETKWVVPEKFFDGLVKVLDCVPPLPGEEAMYSQFRALLDAAAKDPAIKTVLVETAVAAEQEVIAPFIFWKNNGKPAGNGWNRSVNNARFGVDYFNRVGTSKSNMYDNRPTETQYFYTDGETSGAALDGGRTYAITFPPRQEPPVNGFWSMTLYNEHHFFAPNPLNRYSLGTKNKSLERNADGSLTLYAGSKSPGPGKESNWLPAPPGRFSLYIRAYWGKKPILDGTWQPPTIARIN